MISEEEQISQSMQLNWSSLYSLVEQAPFGVYVVDSAFRISLMNLESKKNAFRNVDPVIGRDFADAIRVLWPEEVALSIISEIRHTMESGKPFYSHNYVETRADIDTVEAYEWELHRITLPDGSFGVVCYFYDLTKLKESEQALRRNEVWLQSQKEAFLASINGAPLEESLGLLVESATNYLSEDARASFFLLNADGNAINHITGMGEDYSRAVGDFPVGPDSIGCGLAAYLGQPSIYSNVDTDPDWASHLWLARQFDFRAIWSFPVRVADGKVVGTFCIYYRQPREATPRDMEVASTFTNAAAVIMVHHHATQDRIRTEQILREADHRKDEFLALLAHELRNPLAAIRNAGQILLKANGDQQSLSIAAEILNRQVDHMVKQVDDLFDVNRISRGKIKLKKENAELVKILNHAIGTTRPLLDSLDQELIITIHEEPLYFYCDPIRLAQVFTNLLNNASKFTPKGGKVWITSQRNNDELIISVRDNGIGISELDQQYIFEMFVQLDKSLERTSNGLGLGLSLVKSLVEQHDGVVQVLSGGSGCGSEFVVKLPILTLAVSEGSDKSSDIAQNATSPLRILVADDNRDSAASLALLLELMGHQIEVAYDGLDAVNKADTFCPDVILLDIGMPELNGYDAARRIRDVRKEGYKLVALTGMSKEEDRQLSMQAGFDAHLVKPVDLGSLKEFLTKD